MDLQAQVQSVKQRLEDETGTETATALLEDALDISTIRTLDGVYQGAVLQIQAGGPEIHIYTADNLIVGSWAPGRNSQVAVFYEDRIGLAELADDRYGAE